jgi:autotransporter-associated beta strand protein
LIVSGSFSNVAGGVSTLVLDLRGVATGEWRSSLADGSQANFTSLLTKRDLGTWTITTASTNTYTGATAILANGGTLIVNGAIMKSSGLSVGINSTLAGSGYIGCGVTNGALSFLAPGNNSVGTLTVSNWLNLSPSATCVFEVGDNRCDQVRGLTGVTLGGTLQVSVVGTIYGVESFKLFDAQSYLGGFGGLDLPTLPSPLAWDTTDLNTLGILRVTGGIYIATNSIVGGTMTIAGIGPAGNPYRVLASTNLLLPLNLWTEAGSGILGGDGSFSFTDTNTHSFSQRFYRMVTP